RATTSTGTSRMRTSVSAFGRFSGNIAQWSRYPRPPGAGEILDAGGARERPQRGDGGGQQRPGKDTVSAAACHDQAEEDPAAAVGPAEDELRLIAEAGHPDDDQRRQHTCFRHRVEP